MHLYRTSGVFCAWCCTAHWFHLPRHFFKRDFGDRLLLSDKSNSTEPLTFDVRLRYSWWGESRLAIMNPKHPKRVLYKIICQTSDYCRLLGWTRDRTNITTLASINTMAWYPYPTPDDPDFYDPKARDRDVDMIKSKILLKQPLLISTELYNELFNITFYPSQDKYTIGYGEHHILADVDNFDRSTSQDHHTKDYSLQIFEDIDAEVDPTFLLGICIMIDQIQWPYYLTKP